VPSVWSLARFPASEAERGGQAVDLVGRYAPVPTNVVRRNALPSCTAAVPTPRTDPRERGIHSPGAEAGLRHQSRRGAVMNALGGRRPSRPDRVRVGPARSAMRARTRTRLAPPPPTTPRNTPPADLDTGNTPSPNLLERRPANSRPGMSGGTPGGGRIPAGNLVEIGPVEPPRRGRRTSTLAGASGRGARPVRRDPRALRRRWSPAPHWFNLSGRRATVRRGDGRVEFHGRRRRRKCSSTTSEAKCMFERPPIVLDRGDGVGPCPDFAGFPRSRGVGRAHRSRPRLAAVPARERTGSISPTTAADPASLTSSIS